MTTAERGFHPFAVLHVLRKTILLYLIPLVQVLFERNWQALCGQNHPAGVLS